MEIIQILLLITLIIVVIFTRPAKKERPIEPKVEEITEEEPEIDEKEVEKRKKYEKTKQAFNNLMGYDYEQALGKKEE